MDPIIETERLILRGIDMERDLAPWIEMMSDEETVRYIGGQTMDAAQSWRTMAMMIGHMQIRGYSFMSVIEKASGDWVGRIGHWSPEGWPEPEVGWAVHPDYTRRGFAKEAAAACVDYAYNTLGWTRVIHVIAEGNVGSVKTAEAIGSTRLYPLDGIPGVTDMKCWVYGQEKP